MLASSLKIAFIGSGKMATAIGGGLIKSGKYNTNQFFVADKSGASREQFVLNSGITNVVENNIIAVKSADIVILAVKPQNIEEVCREISSYCKDKLIISIAAGTKLNTFFQIFNHKRIIRVMPNTPMMVGLGASAFSLGEGCTENDKQICLDIFRTVGKIHEVEEKFMDAVTAVSGSGPAYVFQFIQALTDAGVKQGLSHKTALDLVTQTVLGAATMVDKNLGSPEELTKSVTSPNGTTYAALQTMERLGFKNIVDALVAAATARSIELGKPKL